MRIAVILLLSSLLFFGCAIDPLPSPGSGDTTTVDGADGGFNKGEDVWGGEPDDDDGASTAGGDDGTTDTGGTQAGTDGGSVGDDSSTAKGTDGGAGEGTDGGTGEGTAGDMGGSAEMLPTQYHAGRIHSPISPYVAANMKAIASINQELSLTVFMKVGASSTVSNMNLTCFAGGQVDLDVDEAALSGTLDHFLTGDAAGVTPFERKTKAAKVGMSAGWAIKGSPSPLAKEVAAISPTTAIVHYGTNDMGMGTTYLSALWKFGDRLLDLTDELIDQGIIPILMGITPRGDSAAADRWVDTYNAVIRGIAAARQIPHVDLGLAVAPLAGFGLAGDGIHLNIYKENGSYRPCVMTAAGLEYGFNVRNLVSLQALDGVIKTLNDAWELPDETEVIQGIGGPVEPYQISALPFSDLRDTTASPFSNLNSYTGCDASQDESGPEYLYRFTLTETTRIRALVFDRGNVDVDIHLLGGDGSEDSCIARDHQAIQITLAPGEYHFSLDTFVSQGEPQGGEYLFVVLICHPNDPSCDS